MSFLLNTMKKLRTLTLIVLIILSTLCFLLYYIIYCQFSNGSIVPEVLISFYFSEYEYSMMHSFEMPNEKNIRVNLPIEVDKNIEVSGYPSGGYLVIARNPHFKIGNLNHYGPDIYGYFDLRTCMKKFKNVFYFSVLGIALTVLLISYMYHENTLKKRIIILYLFILWCPSLLFFHLLFYRTSYSRDMYDVLKLNEKKIQQELEKKEDKFRVISLPFLSVFEANYSSSELIARNMLPFRFQERNIHQGRALIGISPQNDFRYVRVSSDFFHHFFYAPDVNISQMENLNPDLTFQQLSESFYLGRYDFAINTVNLCRYIYVISLLIWLLIFFFLIKTSPKYSK